MPLDYSRAPYENWDGFTANEQLSLDWDFFAFQAKEWGNIPDTIYICYSHDYVHASAVLFCEFIDKLSKQFNAEVEYYRPEKPDWPHSGSSMIGKIGQRVAAKTRPWLQRKGIH